MWRLFGRKKADSPEPTCAECGRTLLAGEWTQRIVGGDGEELFVCSLCTESRPAEGAQPVSVAAAAGQVRDPRRDTDVFWRAIKEKDAEIERLQAELARSEAEKQELVAKISDFEGQLHAVGAEPEQAPQAAAPEEGLEGEQVAAPTDTAATDTPASDTPASEAEETMAEAEPVAVTPVVAVPVAPVDEEAAAEAGPTLGAAAMKVPPLEEEPGAATEEVAPVVGDASPDSSAQREADIVIVQDDVTPLVVLQRGVDVLNVSSVPRKVIETSESLGMPFVHVGAVDQETLDVTFMWSMGWYRYAVDLRGSGSVHLADRGYEELADLRPNGAVRADGTVQLAPTVAKRPTPKEDGGEKPPAVTSGVIIAKSLMGQRTDDERITPWKEAQARDFDWGQ